MNQRRHRLILFILSMIFIHDEVNASTKSIILEEFQVGKEGRPILVPVHLNDRKLHFLLDTGASRSAFDVSLKKELAPAKGMHEITTSAGRISSPVHPCPEAFIGSQKLNRIGDTLCLDLRPIRYASGMEIDGVLGMDFLRHYAIEINFDRGTLRFWDSAPVQWKKNRTKVPMTWQHNCPTLELKLPGNRNENFLIDTGSNGSSLRSAEFERLHTQKHLTKCVTQKAFTVSGEAEVRTGYINELSLGVFNHVNLRLDRDPWSILGLKYLSRYAVCFDFSNEAIYLTKGERFLEPDSKATSNMAVLEIRGKKIIYEIDPGGAAEDAGLKAGDIIIRVADKPASEYDIHELSKLLTSKKGRAIKIEVYREGRLHTTKLVLVEKCAKL